MNPYSRGGRRRELAQRRVEYLSPQGCSYATEIVENCQQAFTLSQKPNQKAYDVIGAIGGDRTINRVINGFYD